MLTYIEYNDFGLRVLKQQDGALEEVIAQPASVACEGNTLLFGEPAVAVSRTLPQQFNQRYLMAFNSQPLPVAIGPAQNHADLIYHHLVALEIETDVVIGVPGWVSNAQLGFLLGICQEAGLTVRQFVDIALLHAMTAPPGGDFHVLDIEQHRLVLTQFEQRAGSLRSTLSTSLDGLGASHIVEGWMGVIADEFVQHTRFDPLHAGSTEQQLFDQVHNWLGAEQTTTRIVIGADRNQHELEIREQVLAKKLVQRLDSLQLAHVEQLAVTGRVQQFPGLVEFLGSRVTSVLPLPAAELAAPFTQLTQNPAEDVQRITQASISPNSATTVTVAEIELATHLLTDSIARPLSAFSEYIDPSNGKSIHPAVNITHAQGATDSSDPRLAVGTSVVIDNKHYRAIKVI